VTNVGISGFPNGASGVGANATVDVTRLAANAYSPANYLLTGSPTGTFRENMPRYFATANGSALTSGVMTSVALPLFAGDVVTNLSFMSATTAAVAPTAWWFALYSSATTAALIAQTADQTSTAWGGDTIKTLPLSSPYTVSTTGVYYAAVMVTAGTVPTLVTVNGRGAVFAAILSQKALARTSGSGLTTTAPATIASPSNAAALPYCVAT
jgi:hypothetical protein